MYFIVYRRTSGAVSVSREALLERQHGRTCLSENNGQPVYQIPRIVGQLLSVEERSDMSYCSLYEFGMAYVVSIP